MILVTREARGAWSAPQVAPFSGRWLDMEPAMAPDGSYIVFVSNRPAVAGGAPINGLLDGNPQPGKGGNLWRVDRTKKGWGMPRRLPDIINSGGSVYAPSISTDGTLYFMKPAATSGRFQLYSAKPATQGYYEPRPLPFSDGSTTDVDPAVAPDQSFIVFGSSRRARTDIDLYISHHGKAGWGEPVYLGEALNSPTSDAEPRLGPEGRTLYFSSERLVPVASQIAKSDAATVAADMSGWNNGLYNIWQADLRPLLVVAPFAAPKKTAELRAETPDEAGVKIAEHSWSQAFVTGDARALKDLLDSTYASVDSKARAYSKAEVITSAALYAAKHPGAVASPLASNVRITVFGQTAIVLHVNSTDRSVDILRYERGRWIAVYSQHTASPRS